MDEIEKRLAELEELKKKQALHRQQLEENRSRALAKKETDQTPGHTWPDGVCIPAGC